MWSGPRNISTAMMRSFENRPDTYVEDEPFYGHYLFKTGINHPMKNEILNSQVLDWGKVANRLNSIIPNNKTVWYQKHMAQHNLIGYDLSWTKNLINCFLIRDPKEVIQSFSKKLELHSDEQLGYKQQLSLFNMLKNQNDLNPPIIIDSKDILLNPREMLTSICEKIGIPFFEEMLFWPSGSRSTDGIWGKHWYKNVESSIGFNKYENNDYLIPTKYTKIFNDCNNAYLKLKIHKLRPIPLVTGLV